MPEISSDLLKLKRWMEEYVLDRRMADGGDSGTVEGAAPDFSGEPLPAEYQIRLWPAAMMGDQPLYGLLRSSGYDQWQVFPFSPYAFPAIPEELRVREDPPVRVIQGWNLRAVSTRRVAASWWVADLPEEVRFLFARWWSYAQFGKVPSEPFGEEIGPELRHPLDPRISYLDAERIRVDQILGESSAVYHLTEQNKAAEPSEEDSYGHDDDPEL